MGSRLESIREAADRLTVSSLAQTPYCAENTRPVRETFEYATAAGYSWLPVCERGGATRIVETSRLQRLASWSAVIANARPIGVADLIARDAPLFSVLERMESSKLLLCLGRRGIDGVVTIYDLNQPAAHYFGFALATVIEEELGELLRPAVSAASDACGFAGVVRATKVGRGTLRRWEQARRRSEHLDFVGMLSLGEKLRVARLLVWDALQAKLPRYSGKPERLESDLAEMRQLRNAVAHVRADVLEDYQLTCRRLRLVHRLALDLGTGGAR